MIKNVITLLIVSIILIKCSGDFDPNGVTIIELDTNPNKIELGDPYIQIEPRKDKFREGFQNTIYTGRVLVSTTHGGGYHTLTPSTSTGGYAQTKDTEITITATLPLEAEGTMVFFRVIDPDDDSPYEPGDEGNDNVDDYGISPVGAPKSTAKELQIMSQKKYFLGKEQVFAEFSLHIAPKSAGDNYQIEASLTPFDTAAVDTSKLISRSIIYTSWFRRYIEEDRMYERGFLTSLPHEPDNDYYDDTISIFEEPVTEHALYNNSRVVFFTPDSNLCIANFKYYAKKQNGENIAIFDDINTIIPEGSGARPQSYPGVVSAKITPRVEEILKISFGQYADGRNGGGFVEFMMSPYENKNKLIPTVVYPAKVANTIANYFHPWCDATDKTNVLHTIQGIYTDKEKTILGYTTYTHAVPLMILMSSKLNPMHSTHDKYAQTLSHEYGHACIKDELQLYPDSTWVEPLYIDSLSRHDWSGKKQCLMCKYWKYGELEFSKIALQKIRVDNEPLQFSDNSN